MRSVLAIMVANIGSAAFGGTLAGSSHDFAAQLQISPGANCVFCHTPVVAGASLSHPEWARPLPNANYRVYASPTLDASVGQPGEVSRLCLSCHDGTLALGNARAASDGRTGRTSRSLGGSLASEHPIGFVYSSELAHRDASLWDPSMRQVTIGGGGSQRTGTVRAVMLAGGRMECSSCHDVHNRYTVATPSTGRGNALLRISTTGSALCLACHRK